MNTQYQWDNINTMANAVLEAAQDCQLKHLEYEVDEVGCVYVNTGGAEPMLQGWLMARYPDIKCDVTEIPQELRTMWTGKYRCRLSMN